MVAVRKYTGGKYTMTNESDPFGEELDVPRPEEIE